MIHGHCALGKRLHPTVMILMAMGQDDAIEAGYFIRRKHGFQGGIGMRIAGIDQICILAVAEQHAICLADIEAGEAGIIGPLGLGWSAGRQGDTAEKNHEY